MSRQFVVVTEIISVMTDLDRRFIELNELQRTDVGDRLHDAVLRREIFGESRAEISNFVKTREKVLRGRSAFGRARFRGRRSIFWSDRGLDQVIPPSCSSSSRRASN